MSIKTDPIIVEIIARHDKFRSDTANARALYVSESQKMQMESDRLRQRIERNSGAIGGNLKALSGSIAAYFSGRELAGIIDSFTMFENRLKVVGVAGADLAAVQDRLFASAQRYGVGIGALGELFGSLSSASKELGASQEQVFKLTDAVSASLKVSGGSAQEASSTILQLSQALRGGTIQAAEFNPLLDAAYPLLEAAAKGSDRFGGSVGTLTRLVKDGKVSSAEFFDAILKGSTDLEGRAAKATLTLSGAYVQLQNALTVYVGRSAEASGAQAALAAGITAIAQNLDTLIPAIAVLTTAMGVRYVAGAGAAAVATLRADAALLGLASRAEVAGFAIGSLARALAVNGAILAVTAAIGGFAVETARTQALVAQANTQYDEMRKRLQAAAEMAKQADDGARGVGSGAATAEPQVRKFAGAVGDLAKQLYAQAKAARAAKVEMIGKRLADSQAAELELGKRTPGGRNASVADLRRGDFLNNAGVIGRAATGSLRSLLSGGRTDREAVNALTKQVNVSRELQQQLKAAQNAPLESFVPDTVVTPTGGGGGGKTKGGRSAESDAKQRAEEQRRIETEIANAQVGYLQELAASSQNAAERAELERRVIEATRAANQRDIETEDRLSKAQREKLVELNSQVATLRAQQVTDRENERLRQEQLRIITDSMRDEDSLLQIQARLATTLDQRRQIELRRLEIAYDLEKAAIAEELAAASIAKDMGRIAAASKRLADLQERKDADTALTNRENEGPYASYRRSLDELDIGTRIDAIKVDALRNLEDELVDATTAAFGLQGALGNIVGELVRVGLQRKLLGPAADFLFGAADGSTGGAVGGLLDKVFGALATPVDGDGTGPATAGGNFQAWSA